MNSGKNTTDTLPVSIERKYPSWGSTINYLDIVRFAFYPVLLIFFTCLTVQLGLLRTPEEKEALAEKDK